MGISAVLVSTAHNESSNVSVFMYVRVYTGIIYSTGPLIGAHEQESQLHISGEEGNSKFGRYYVTVIATPYITALL